MGALDKRRKGNEQVGTNKTNDLTATNLKNALWETLQGIRDGSVEPGTGDAIASQAREILRTVKVQLQICSQAKRDVSAEVIVFAEK